MIGGTTTFDSLHVGDRRPGGGRAERLEAPV